MRHLDQIDKRIDFNSKNIDKLENKQIAMQSGQEAISKDKDMRFKWYAILWAAVGAIVGILGILGVSLASAPK